MTLMLGRTAVAQGDLERAEKLLRDSERALKGLGGRGQLCEAQRVLAQVLVKLGRLEEAERFALENALEFFRDRGRDDEVARYEARRAELLPSSTAPIA
jgi:RNA-splicing ligase RtcB